MVLIYGQSIPKSSHFLRKQPGRNVRMQSAKEWISF